MSKNTRRRCCNGRRRCRRGWRRERPSSLAAGAATVFLIVVMGHQLRQTSKQLQYFLALYNNSRARADMVGPHHQVLMIATTATNANTRRTLDGSSVRQRVKQPEAFSSQHDDERGTNGGNTAKQYAPTTVMPRPAEEKSQASLADPDQEAADQDLPFLKAPPWRLAPNAHLRPREVGFDSLDFFYSHHGVHDASSSDTDAGGNNSSSPRQVGISSAVWKQNQPEGPLEKFLKDQLFQLTTTSPDELFHLNQLVQATQSLVPKFQVLHVFQCTTYTTEAGDFWYGAVGPHGGFYGLITNDSPHSFQLERAVLVSPKSLNLPPPESKQLVYQEEPHNISQVDIIVPFYATFTYQMHPLREFIKRTVATVERTRNFGIYRNTTFRILVSHFASDVRMRGLRTKINEDMVNSKTFSQLEFVECADQDGEDTRFSRSAAVNCVLERRACRDPDCLVAVFDMDLHVDRPVFTKSYLLVKAGAMAYFPIIYSRYNPDNVKLIYEEVVKRDKKLNNVIIHSGEDQRGTWRAESKGTWIMAGSDAAQLRLPNDDSDEDFYNQVRQRLHIVRLKEVKTLEHSWHPHNCSTTTTRLKTRRRACRSAEEQTEGSLLQRMLRLRHNT